MRVQTERRVDFLPRGVSAYLRRRGMELLGGVMILAALLWLVALIGYDAGDPSLNTASGRAPVNPLGARGALLADLALQMLGLAAYVPTLPPLVWGWLFLTGRRPNLFWLRLLLTLVATLLAAMALVALPSAEGWIPDAGSGGTLGGLPLQLLPEAWADAASGWLSLGAGVAFFPVFYIALALGFAQWMAIIRRIAALRRLPARLAGIWKGVFQRSDAGAGRAARTSPRPAMKSARTPPRIAAPATPSPPSPRAQAARQGNLDLPTPEAEYLLPGPELLTERQDGHGDSSAGSREGLEQNARLLETVLEDFGVRGEIVMVRPGPVVTLYELEPAPGTKISRVIGLADDIARSMSAISVRIATVPGRSVIGIELPNARREMVGLRELLSSTDYEASKARLPLILGKDIGGAPKIVDLASMPHLLIAGTTGSGKSVGLNAMILSVLYRFTPAQCRFIMIDPKMLELSVYDDIPHLLTPVVTDPRKAVVALKWAVREMENRYRAMSRLSVRNIEGYNRRIAEAAQKGEILTHKVQTGFDAELGRPVFEDRPLDLDELPYIVVVVDEMADLMLVAGKDIEASIQRLAQMARAAGIHLIMATQRPSVDVITGTIKANFPTRISFQVTSRVDSRTILGEQGAEQLLGSGDMLHMAGGGRIMRIHGPFVDDGEVEAVCSHLRAQGSPAYLDSVTDEEDMSGGFATDVSGAGHANAGSDNPLYDQAVALVAQEGKCSTSFVQRHLQIGYNRAARLVEQMEKEGVVSAANHVGKREVLIGGGDG